MSLGTEVERGREKGDEYEIGDEHGEDVRSSKGEHREHVDLREAKHQPKKSESQFSGTNKV